MIIGSESESVDCDYAHIFPSFSLLSVFETILEVNDGHQYLNYCIYYYCHHYFVTSHLHYIHDAFNRERNIE